MIRSDATKYAAATEDRGAIDCVVGYHLNPMRCGVAKFNHMLALRLGVPVFGIFDDALAARHAPILSLKVDEFAAEDLVRLEQRVESLLRLRPVRVFLHQYTFSPFEKRLIEAADTVYVGNAELAAELTPVRPDVVELWAPGMIENRRAFGDAELSVLSFGMAHKVRAEQYHRLKDLLDRTGRSYELYVSTALHENSSFDDEFGAAFGELEVIFGERAHFLGYLSDAALYNYLTKSTYFAAFFSSGLRANNTSVNAALELGCAVITNLDEHSPSILVHGENILDIGAVDALPTEPSQLAALRQRAQTTAARHLSWDAVIQRLAITSGHGVARNGPAEG